MKRRVVALGAVCAVVAAASAGLLVWSDRDPAAPDWPAPMKDSQARALLRDECRAAASAGQPLLVEFSAPWCEHCQAVKQTIRKTGLSDLLSGFRNLVLNIGNDDELDDLRRELEARAIPAWVVIEPSQCDAEPKRWKRVANTYPRGDEERLREFLERLGPLGKQ